MELVWSDKFKNKIKIYFDYCLSNYGETLTKKKRNELDKILKSLLMFPESGRIEQLLQGMNKIYRTINLDKLFKIIYTVSENTITIETLWNMKRNPKTLKKDI